MTWSYLIESVAWVALPFAVGGVFGVWFTLVWQAEHDRRRADDDRHRARLAHTHLHDV